MDDWETSAATLSAVLLSSASRPTLIPLLSAAARDYGPRVVAAVHLLLL